MRRHALVATIGPVVASLGALTLAAEVVVHNPQQLRSALQHLEPSTTLKIAPGVYPGGQSATGVTDLTVAALDPNDPPHFQGGNGGWHFSRCDRLVLRHLRVSGQSRNGINIDDGGNRQQPTSQVTIDSVQVSDIGPQGNFDAIKCSGVRQLTIRRCTLSGWGGQGIDLVGCHEVVIADCRFVGKPGYSATAGVQIKGGSSDVTVENCHFRDAGQRPLNVGGSTGMAYFRPPDARHEAARITVRNNRIEGSLCAAAFVGVDGAEFSDNVILFPERWVFRILQETRAEGFVPCRNVLIARNQIVFRREQVRVEVNIGDGTAPETFRFVDNRWYAEDRPTASRPTLPVAEESGSYGTDPR